MLAESSLIQRQHAHTLRASHQMQVHACAALRACALKTLAFTATQATTTDAVQYQHAQILMAPQTTVMATVHAELQSATLYLVGIARCSTMHVVITCIQESYILS